MIAIYKLSMVLFAITAIATLLARNCVYEWLAITLDLIPFIGAVALGAVSAFRLAHDRVTSLKILCISYSCFASALIGALGAAHLVSVTIEILQEPFVYDFRTYSLLQLGLLLIVIGGLGVAFANRLMKDIARGGNQMAMVWIIILWISIPMIPLQGFAILFTVLGSVGLVILWRVRNAGMPRHARDASGSQAIYHE